MSQIFTWPPVSATTSNPSVGLNGATAPAQSNQVAGQNPSGDLTPLSLDASDNLLVAATSLPLPTGAATEATLLQVDSDIQAGNALLTSIDGKLANPMPVTGPLTDTQLRASAVVVTGPLTDTQLRASAVPVSLSSVPLPTGAATEATLLQVDSDIQAGNALLTSIDGKLANPMPVTGPLTDTQLRASAVAVSAASLPLPTGAATESTLSAMSAKLPATLGQKAMAASLAVVLASDQSVIPVSISSIPAQSGRSVVTTVRNDYTSVNVTTGAWVQLVASLSSSVNMVEIFDSSGQTLELGIGSPSSETRLILVFPGGNGQVPVAIASGSRLSVRAVSATANTGELDINLYS